MVVVEPHERLLGLGKLLAFLRGIVHAAQAGKGLPQFGEGLHLGIVAALRAAHPAAMSQDLVVGGQAQGKTPGEVLQAQDPPRPGRASSPLAAAPRPADCPGRGPAPGSAAPDRGGPGRCRRIVEPAARAVLKDVHQHPIRAGSRPCDWARCPAAIPSGEPGPRPRGPGNPPRCPVSGFNSSGSVTSYPCVLPGVALRMGEA